MQEIKGETVVHDEDDSDVEDSLINDILDMHQENLKTSNDPVCVAIGNVYRTSNDYAEELERRLKPLCKAGRITILNNTRPENLPKADLFLPLVAADALVSEELGEQLEQVLQQVGRTRILPIYLYWVGSPPTKVHPLHTILSTFGGFPRYAKPLHAWDDAEAAWLEIYQGIEEAAEIIRMHRYSPG